MYVTEWTCIGITRGNFSENARSEKNCDILPNKPIVPGTAAITVFGEAIFEFSGPSHAAGERCAKNKNKKTLQNIDVYEYKAVVL